MRNTLTHTIYWHTRVRTLMYIMTIHWHTHKLAHTQIGTHTHIHTHTHTHTHTVMPKSSSCLVMAERMWSGCLVQPVLE